MFQRKYICFETSMNAYNSTVLSTINTFDFVLAGTLKLPLHFHQRSL